MKKIDTISFYNNVYYKLTSPITINGREFTHIYIHYVDDECEAAVCFFSLSRDPLPANYYGNNNPWIIINSDYISKGGEFTQDLVDNEEIYDSYPIS